MTAIVGIAAHALLLHNRTAVTVDEDGLLIDCRPLIKRRIFASEIASVSTVGYRGIT